MSSGKSPFDVPMATSYSSTAGASRTFASNATGGNTRRSVDFARPTGVRSGAGGLDIFNSGNLGVHNPSSSSATSSSNALSGLARLIHSHGTARDGHRLTSSFSTSREQSERESYMRETSNHEGLSTSQRGMMSRVKGAKGDMNIGDGVFHSSLRHLSATVNQMDSEPQSDMTFR